MIDWTRMVTAQARAAADLDAAKTQARADLAAAIAASRATYITNLPGQEMIYLAKEAEARDWLADPVPDPAGYPLLAAEIGITAPTAFELAQLWLNMGAIWRDAAAQLEALRLTTAAAITAATTPAEVAAAMEGIET